MDLMVKEGARYYEPLLRFLPSREILLKLKIYVREEQNPGFLHSMSKQWKGWPGYAMRRFQGVASNPQGSVSHPER